MRDNPASTAGRHASPARIPHIHASMNDDAHTRKSTAERLVAALRDDEFILYAQKIDCIADDLDGRPFHEILVRLKEEEQKHLPPGMFIPLLQDLHLMPMLDRWVVAAVIRWLRRHRTAEADWPLPRNSVNLAADTLTDERFAGYVHKHLEGSKLPGWTLSFEIFCEDAIRHPKHVQRTMAELRALGCSFSLAGFSGDHLSLVVLESVRPDFVKIEGGLASRMDRDLEIYTRVEAIFRKCRDMGIRTVAEHVEDRGALLRLREVGVDYAQGFFIGHPEPLA